MSESKRLNVVNYTHAEHVCHAREKSEQSGADRLRINECLFIRQTWSETNEPQKCNKVNFLPNVSISSNGTVTQQNLQQKANGKESGKCVNFVKLCAFLFSASNLFADLHFFYQSDDTF